MPRREEPIRGEITLLPGTSIGEFRIERRVGSGRCGTVYEAIQLSLGRRVALKLLSPALAEDPALGARLRAWPEHSNALPLYSAGVCPQGWFVATPFIGGGTLAQLSAQGQHGPARVLECLGQVASVIDAIHAGGHAHGVIHAGNVLIDRSGRALVGDFGLTLQAPTLAGDRADFVRLVQAVTGLELDGAERRNDSAVSILRSIADPGQGRGATPHGFRPPPSAGQHDGRARAWWVGLGGVAGLLLAAGVFAWASPQPRSGDHSPTAPLGAQPLGSPLTARRPRPLACDAQPPSGASPACTIMQLGLRGQQLTASRDGVIRDWSVLGAHGELAVQVIRRVGARYVQAARSQYEPITDPGLHTFPVNVAIRRGERIAVELAPDSSIGVATDRGDATADRWVDPLGFAPRRPTHGPGSGLDREILLRAAYVPGERPKLPWSLTGAAADAAPGGVALGAEEVALARGAPAQLVVVGLAQGIVLDLESGSRRLARLAVPDADPRGHLVLLGLGTGPNPGPHLEWANPDGITIAHDYRVGDQSLTPID